MRVIIFKMFLAPHRESPHRHTLDTRCARRPCARPMWPCTSPGGSAPCPTLEASTAEEAAALRTNLLSECWRRGPLAYQHVYVTLVWGLLDPRYLARGGVLLFKRTLRRGGFNST